MVRGYDGTKKEAMGISETPAAERSAMKRFALVSGIRISGIHLEIRTI